MINTTVSAGRMALAALVLASSVAVLAGCSSAVVAPQDVSGVTGPGPRASARAVSTVGDDQDPGGGAAVGGKAGGRDGGGGGGASALEVDGRVIAVVGRGGGGGGAGRLPRHRRRWCRRHLDSGQRQRARWIRTGLR